MPLLSLSRWRILNRDASETDVTIVSPVHGVAMHHEGGMWIPVCPKRGGTHCICLQYKKTASSVTFLDYPFLISRKCLLETIRDVEIVGVHLLLFFERRHSERKPRERSGGH